MEGYLIKLIVYLTENTYIKYHSIDYSYQSRPLTFYPPIIQICDKISLNVYIPTSIFHYILINSTFSDKFSLFTT